jgi:type IV pilus assembly protein PilW
MKLKSLKAIIAKSKKAPTPAPADPGGFTLIELLVAMAIASVMLAAVISLFVALNKSYTRQNAAADAQQIVRSGVDFMAQSIRLAGLDPEQTGKFGIGTATATSIDFTADFNLSGGDPELPDERISYSFSGGELHSSLSPPGVPLVDNVTDLVFTYLAADNSILATPVSTDDLAAIRTVQIALTVREPAGRGKTVARTYATEVKCRNLGF